MNTTLAIGLLAGFLGTISMAPQLVKAVATKQTKDLSLGTYILLSAALSLWVTYGILISDFPLIFWNSIALCLTIAVLIAKLKYG